MSTTTTHPNTVAQAGTQSSRVWPAVAAAFLGLVILFAVGFANSNVLHNAAHDSRHSFAFPCH
jgi:cobalt transporter subunit CbtB